ncbi:AMP-binding protein [Mycobacterium sp. NPDC003449]
MDSTPPGFDADAEGVIRRLNEVFGAADANAAELLVDAHDPQQVAFTTVWRTDDGYLETRQLTYGELAQRSARLATGLAELGVTRGSRVGVLMSKRSELVLTLLAVARLGAVYIPLFTAFAPAAIDMRLRAAGATLVVTEPSQEHKLDGLPVERLVTGADFDDLIAANHPLATSVAVGGDGELILLFTSGTTGPPKGVPVPLRALAAFTAYLRYGLDVTSEDVYWNAADPGWAYGLYYGVLGPLAAGRANILVREGFSPEWTTQVLAELGVTNFAAAPTVYRALAKSGPMPQLRLRCASSAGEPLTPDVVEWAKPALGTEVRDHYGQTEHGMVINNHWEPSVRRDLEPGSMGQPMPGFRAAVHDGEIALDAMASPLMWFRGYLDAENQTRERYSADGRWYLTGDAGRQEPDGNFYFQARDDDVIIMAGYRIGPFDIESVLIRHPAVVDVAVVGRPDEMRGEVVEAYVVLADTGSGDADLAAELQQMVKKRYAAHAYPRTVHFVDELPKTPSGKVQRYLLRK